MKKIYKTIFMFLMCSVSIGNVFAAEVINENVNNDEAIVDSVNENKNEPFLIFSKEEIIASYENEKALELIKNECLFYEQMFEVMRGIDSGFLVEDYLYNYFYDFNKSYEKATFKDFLIDFIGGEKAGIIIEKNGEFFYPFKNSKFLSDEEWKFILLNLDKNITFGDGVVFLERYKNFVESLSLTSYIKDSEYYKEVVNSYFPEFNTLIEYDENILKNWLDLTIEKNGNTVTYRSDTVFNIMHELQHEISAKKAGVYKTSGKKNDGGYYVTWKGKPEDFYYYNLKKGEWVSIKTTSVPPTRDIARFLSLEERDVSFYKNYVMSSTSASNNWGIYGLMTELISYSIDLRMSTIAASVNFIHNDVPSHYIEACYFEMATIFDYINHLKKHIPSLYKEVVNEKMLELLIDTCLYNKESLNFIEKISNKTEQLSVLENQLKDAITEFLILNSNEIIPKFI